MIETGQNPEGNPRLVKFLAGDEGFRGILIARQKDGKDGIVLALTTSIDGQKVRWGRLYKIHEESENEYARVEMSVDELPNLPDWEVQLEI